MRRFASFLAALLFASAAHAQSYPAPVFSGLGLNGKGALAIGSTSATAGSVMKQDWLWSDGVFDAKTLGGLWPTSTYAWQVLNKTFTGSSVSGQGTLYSALSNGPLITQLTIAANNGATADVVSSLNFCEVQGSSGGSCFGGNDVVHVPTGKSGKLTGREIDMEFATGSTDAGGSIGLPINVFNIASNATAMHIGSVSGGSWANGVISRGVRGAHYSVDSGDGTTAASFINTQNGTFSNTAIVTGTGAGQGINFGGGSWGVSPYLYGDSGGNATLNMGAGGNVVIQKPDGSQAFTLNQYGEINMPNGGSYKINGTSVLTGNVQGTGFPGMDNVPGSYMLYASGTNANALLRVQRAAPASGGTSGNTYKGVWGLSYTGANNAGYEWAVTGELHNNTLASTGAQNVAVNGTAFKEAGASGSVGPTWGGNFSCTDKTGENNPVASCIGAELDVAVQSGSATTDTNKQRVGLQIAATAQTAGTHVGRGILINTDANTTIDRALDFSGTMSKGFDATAVTWSVAPIFLGAGQKIVLDGDTSGNSNRSLWYSTGSLIYTTQNGNVFQVDDSGGVAFGAAAKLMKLAAASLPTCNSGAEGYLYAVTDASSATFNAALSGGGSNHVMAYCNGSAWTVH